MKDNKEELCEKIVNILGHDKEDFDCANNKTLLSVLFDENYYSDEFELLYDFIYSCDLTNFKKLKNFVEHKRII